MSKPAPSYNSSNGLLEELLLKKNKAFAKLNHALNTDENSDCFDEKIVVYKCSLTLIEDALKFYTQNDNNFDERHYAAQIYRQLNDIKMKTIIRLNDLYELNKPKPSKPTQSSSSLNSKYLSSCISATSILLDTSIDSTYKRKSKLEKSQIGLPFDFKLVQHVGLTNNRFDIHLASEDESSEKMKQLLLELNVPINKKTAAFVESFVKDNGGIERFSDEINKQKAPTVKALAFKNLRFHDQNLQNDKQSRKSLNQQVAVIPPRPKKPLPPHPSPTPPPFPTSIDRTKHYENQSSVDFDLTLPYESTPEPPLNASLVALVPSVQPISHPPPPPPPPPPLPLFLQANPKTQLPLANPIQNKSFRQENLIRTEYSTDSERQVLLDSIRSFRGFQSKNTAQQDKRNSETTSLQLSTSSIVEQLKSELAKRSQFLNDSSDPDDTECTDDWQ